MFEGGKEDLAEGIDETGHSSLVCLPCPKGMVSLILHGFCLILPNVEIEPDRARATLAHWIFFRNRFLTDTHLFRQQLNGADTAARTLNIR